MECNSIPPSRTSSMAPTVQPPPPTKNPGVAPTPAASLDDIIQKLYDLIHNIALPKTKTAKTAAITVEALRTARSLAASARTSLPAAHLENLVLNKVSTQLDAIAVQLAIPIAPSSSGKQSYASTLASGAHPLCYAPCRGYPSPGLGRVGFGVRTDVASASGSLCQLVFLVQDFSHGQRARHEVRRRERQRGGKLRVRSGQCYTAMIFDN